jgi:hypothetical protein
MAASPRIRSPLSCLAIAAIVTVVAGCAGSPQPSSPAPSSANATPAASAETPASVSNLVDTADFTKKAQDEGWRPEVRDGQVVYCKDESPLGSRLPELTCLNKTSVAQMMLAEERQREAMQRAAAAAGQSGN